MIFFQRIIKISVIFLSYVSIVITGCLSPIKSTLSGETNFCQRNYSHDSFIIPFMEGVSSDNGRTVYDKYTGFFCETSMNDSPKNCNINMTTNKSRDGKFYCKSKLHPLTDLCEKNEYLRYFDSDEVKCNK